MEMSAAFWIILTGILVAASCGLLGSFLVLRKMSLLGDAISHAVLPGIAIAFLLSASRDIFPMIIGAAAFGLLTVFLIETLHKKWRVQEDASIGIIFTALFAIGVILITALAGHIDLDQECVLYGEIAYTPWDVLVVGGQEIGPRPVWLLGTVFVIDILFILLFYKELLISSFDPGLALSLGFNVSLIHYLFMGAVSLTTVAAFESVGAILVVAMLIVPGATAYLWTDRLQVMLVLSVLVGAVSAVGGYILAVYWNSSIAGAMTVAAGLLFALSVVFSPRYGLLGRLVNRFKLGLQYASDHILLILYRQLEQEAAGALRLNAIYDATSTSRLQARFAFALNRRSGLLEKRNKHIHLTERGREKARELLQAHRLWESFASRALALPQDHLHDSAHRMEHFIDAPLRSKISASIETEDDRSKDHNP